MKVFQRLYLFFTCTCIGCASALPISTKFSLPPLHIPHDAIWEILLRLPVKSLLRFRCVCKSWRSLISSPQFIKDQLRIASTRPNFTQQIFFWCCDRDLSFCYILHGYSRDHTKGGSHPIRVDGAIKWSVLEGSCNGLICISAVDGLYLLNPSTRKCKRLGKFSRWGRDNWNEITCMGFGYDESTDDYKVVQFLIFKQNTNQYVTRAVTVYSLKTGLWRSIGNFPSDYVAYDSGKFVNGKLYWFANVYIPSARPAAILSFDLATNTYEEIGQPDYDDDSYNLSLEVFEGCLSVLCVSECCWVIWIMKDLGLNSTWTKLATETKLGPSCLNKLEIQNPMCITEKGEMLIFLGGGHFILYNPKDGTVRNPTERDNFPNFRCKNVKDPKFLGLRQACNFVESLVSPDAYHTQF